jgi:hypothetical protein
VDRRRRRKKNTGNIEAAAAFYLVCADASALCRQSDIGETLVGEESTKDFEQVTRVVVPFQAKLMMRHFHGSW